MAQSAAETLLFIVFLVGATIIGFYLLAYAARCILTVVQGTAGGMDRVEWADEPIIDWASNSMALAGLVLIWLIPIGFLSRALEGTWLPGRGALRTILLAVPALWLTFPIGSLSSLSAVSRWAFFRPVIAGRMLRLFPSTLLFYLGSALLGALALVPMYVAIVAGRPWLLVLAGPLTAAALLIYARILGRLAWRIVQLGPLKVSEARKPALVRKPTPAAPQLPLAPIEVEDPWAGPQTAAEPVAAPRAHSSPTGLLEEENCDPYGLANDKGPTQPQQEEQPAVPQRPLDPEEEEARRGYGTSEEEEKDASPEPARRKKTRRKGAPRAGRKGPPGSSFGGVIGFPWYDTSLSAWVWLSLGTTLLGALLVGLVQFMPPVGN